MKRIILTIWATIHYIVLRKWLLSPLIFSIADCRIYKKLIDKDTNDFLKSQFTKHIYSRDMREFNQLMRKFLYRPDYIEMELNPPHRKSIIQYIQDIILKKQKDFTLKKLHYFFFEDLPFGRDCDDFAHMWRFWANDQYRCNSDSDSPRRKSRIYISWDYEKKKSHMYTLFDNQKQSWVLCDYTLSSHPTKGDAFDALHGRYYFNPKTTIIIRYR